MIAVDIALVVLLLFGIGAVIYSVNHRVTVKAQTAPNRELVKAVSIIERMLTADDVQPVVPARLRQEAEALIDRYQKELS